MASSSRSPQSHQSHPPLPPLPPLQSDPIIQVWCIYVISNIYEACTQDIPIADKVIRSENIRFFLKGGNAIALLSGGGVPYPFTGDFDCELLVNPNLPRSDFISVYYALVLKIIRELQTAISDEWFYDEVWQSLENNLHTPALHYDNTIHLLRSRSMKGTTTNIDRLGDIVYESKVIRDFKIPAKSPFLMSIIPNFEWNGKELGLGVIRIQTRTEPRATLLEISLPRVDYKYLPFLWDTYTYTLYRSERMQFEVLDALSQYMDLRFASSVNERPAFKEKRTRRANRIRNTILKPQRSTYKRKMNRLADMNYTINGKSFKALMNEL